MENSNVDSFTSNSSHGARRRSDRGRGPKVEFSPSLASIDSEVAEEHSTNPSAWDSEAEYMLSYFLGGEAHNVLSVMPEFAPSYAPSDSRNDSVSSSASDDECPTVPATPAIQFYSSSHSGTSAENHRGAESGGNMSSFSLSSMAATLVSGGPLVHQKLQQQNQQIMQGGNTPDQNPSPISPAALIGVGHENLMLPPPARNPSKESMQTESEWRDQHLAWIRDINAMAQNSTISNGGQILPQPQAQTSIGYAPYYAVGHLSQILAAGLSEKTSQKSPQESEAKRKKRLARNRESARKSRLRKKERLTGLEKQVNKMYKELCVVRNRHLSYMVPALRSCRTNEFERFDCTATSSVQEFELVVTATGPNGTVMRLGRDYQSSTIRQLIFPRYHQLLLWITLQEPIYFVQARREFAKRSSGKSKASVGKVSSKQIGEEIANLAQASAPSYSGEDDSREEDGESQLCASVGDVARFWPLFCFENSFSFEQEEKFISTHQKISEMVSLPHTRTQMSAGLVSVQKLKEALDFLSSAAALRENASYLDVLEPRQVICYSKWVKGNTERIAKLMDPARQREGSQNKGREASLLDICARLSQNLKISARNNYA